MVHRLSLRFLAKNAFIQVCHLVWFGSMNNEFRENVKHEARFPAEACQGTSFITAKLIAVKIISLLMCLDAS
jgi:hypothetical protein